MEAVGICAARSCGNDMQDKREQREQRVSVGERAGGALRAPHSQALQALQARAPVRQRPRQARVGGVERVKVHQGAAAGGVGRAPLRGQAAGEAGVVRERQKLKDGKGARLRPARGQRAAEVITVQEEAGQGLGGRVGEREGRREG